MYELLFQDAARKERASHDFGRDIIPAMIAAGSRVFAYPFRDENRKGAAYWRDVGTHRRLFPDQHGPDPDRPDPESLRPGLADPHLSAAVSAAEIRPHRGGPPGRRVQLDRLPGGDHLGRAGLSAASSRRACGSTATPWSKMRSCWTASWSAAMPASAAPSSIRTSESPHRFRDRLEPRRRPRPGLHRHPTTASPSSPRGKTWSGSCECPMPIGSWRSLLESRRDDHDHRTAPIPMYAIQGGPPCPCR